MSCVAQNRGQIFQNRVVYIINISRILQVLWHIWLRHAYQNYVCVSLKSGNRSPIQTVRSFKTPLPYFSYTWNSVADPDPDPFGSEPFCQTGSGQNKPDPDPDPASVIEITLDKIWIFMIFNKIDIISENPEHNRYFQRLRHFEMFHYKVPNW